MGGAYVSVSRFHKSAQMSKSRFKKLDVSNLSSTESYLYLNEFIYNSRGLVRIRPSHTKKAKLVSADIDKLTNAPAQLTNQGMFGTRWKKQSINMFPFADIVKNLDDLIMAKLKKRP